MKGKFRSRQEIATGTPTTDAAEGRLRARPRTSPIPAAQPGLHRLGSSRGQDAVLYVPAGYPPDVPAPFALSLHGAGGNAEGGLYPLRDLADAAGLVLLSPASRGRTWDVILGSGFGSDVTLIDQMLEQAFAQINVNPRQLAIAGFSDGASYALSLGISNGDLFGRIMAFSPGFAAPASQHGAPQIFISHGKQDAVLPIGATSRRVAPRLEQAGYDVHYVEFEGGHSVPPRIAREAVDWFLSTEPTATPMTGAPPAREETR